MLGNCNGCNGCLCKKKKIPPKLRIGFTIAYECLHHLKHKGMADFMAENFDYWIVIEGLSGAGGSTAWCKNLELSPRSTDGTHEFMEGFAKQHPHVIYFSPGTRWNSKDDMVNEAVKVLKFITDYCYLWQIDADEIWSKEQLERAETELESKAGNVGAFQFTHYLCKTDTGDQLVGLGQWGSGFNTRLFKWRGEKFIKHEPPTLAGQKKVTELTQKYHHYSYYFEKDVQFKSMFYQGHEQVYKNWLYLKKGKTKFPVSLSALFGSSRKFKPELSTIDVLNPNPSCHKQEDVVQGQSLVQ